MDKNEKVVRDSLAALKYNYKRNQAEFEQYERSKSFGYSQLTINYKNRKLNALSWSESVLYTSIIMSEILSQEFILDDNSTSVFQVYKNNARLLILTLIDHSDDGYIVVTIGKEEVNGGKTASSKNNTFKKEVFFSGTKKFCDSLDAWYYTVTIKSDSIILKSLPGKKNTYYKDKAKPVEIISGIIKNGKIITRGDPKYLTSRFKFENGMLYEMNNEGEYNEYYECK